MGIVLAKPGAKPKIIYATGGRSSLRWTALRGGGRLFWEPGMQTNASVMDFFA